MNNIYQFEDRETVRHEACEWLVRLDGDEPLLRAEKQQLHQWMGRSPAHRHELVRLAEFWDSSNILTELLIPMHQVVDVQRRNHSLWAFIGRYFASSRGGALVAMSLLLVVFALRGYLFPQPLDATNGIYAAAIGELRVETLVDGSVLQINTDSQVQVVYSEQARKIRLLRGEAHFKVAHNVEWPFEVYAAKGVVKAVGTAFSVRVEEESLSVIVTDGRVDLAAPSEVGVVSSVSQGVVGEAFPVLERVVSLREGEGILFNSASNPKVHMVLAEREMARQLSWREGYLVFEGEPLTVVVAELNRYLPVQVEIADDSLNDIPIGGRFKVGELEALFEVLETSFSVRVSRSDDRHIQLFSKTNKNSKR